MNKSIDQKRKYFKDSIYLKYETLNNNEFEKKDFKDSIVKKKKGPNILQKIAVVIIVGMVSLSAYAGINNSLNFEKLGLMKLSKNYEEGSVEVNKTIETENCNITLTSMGADDAYVIAQYRLEFKNDILSKLGPIEKSEHWGYNIYFYGDVFVNSKKINNVISRAEKISENEYEISQIINIMEIKEKDLNVEVNIDSIYSTGFAIHNDNSIRIGKKISSRVQLTGDESKVEAQKIQLDDHTEIILEGIGNTKFQTYITLKKITEGITFEEYNNLNPMAFNSFIISTENDEVLSYTVYDSNTAGKKIFVNENGNYEERDIIRTFQKTDIIKVEENYFVLMGDIENIDKIKVTPVETRIYDDRKLNKNGETEESEMYNKATWYPIEVGDKKYSAIDSLGGTFEVEKIEVDDDNIYFYYNEKGLIGNQWKIIVRGKSKKINYIHATSYEQKGLDSEENRIIFSRNLELAAGLNSYEVSLDNLENLEFTLLFGSVSKKVGKAFIVDFPKLIDDTAQISNFEITDIKLKPTQEELQRSPDMSGKYTNKEELSPEYSKEEAIKDNCFVIEEGVVVSEDKEQLDKFMEDCNNGINGVIRIFGIDSYSWNYIKDIEYTDGIFYIEEYHVETKRNVKRFDYGTTKMVKDKDDEGNTIYTLIGENNMGVVCKIKAQ